MIISAGNDIVDLGTINATRTKDQRFYTKFITGTETTLYNQPHLADMPFEYFVWMLWSVKESVYKFMQRHNPGLVFSPSKIIVEQIESHRKASIPTITQPEIEAEGFAGLTTYNSIIAFGADNFYSRSIINSNYIATIVNNSNDLENIYWGIKRIDQSEPEYQSRAVRQFLLKKLASVFDTDDLRIIKNTSGCPVLFSGDLRVDIPVSLAHHGHYVAYAFPNLQ
jgi:phosphopantetheinyl transferase (holo-ACP synthase)